MYGTVFAPLRRPITGNEYVQLLEKYKPRINWDSDSEESYWEFSDGEMEGEVWYPSLYSIRYLSYFSWGNGSKRLNLVQDFNVGGVSLWELGQVTSNLGCILIWLGIRLLLRIVVKIPISDEAEENLTRYRRRC